jgi:hypothetical protein
MIKRHALLILTITAIVTFGSGLTSAGWAQEAKPADASAAASAEGVGSTSTVTIHGKIVAVDKATKLVTLEGPGGRKVAVKVENPSNLAAAKVGEPVVARIHEIATIRKKQPGETLPAVSVKEGISTAAPGEAPGGVAAGQATIVVSVVAIDQPNGTITVKGSDDAVETVKARYPRKLKLLKVGDELVISFWRGIAISLDKESGS